ncbi:hypothetical protein RN001_004668 [Aquatica leii]|uniref:Uncharacterized protein n=1 Tax=Aquatica leii TaxID=1421715 RepID=A0AAN7PBN5_9COLE|nr:hypothetical protein RN001_004668 [Aquatica leii]
MIGDFLSRDASYVFSGLERTDINKLLIINFLADSEFDPHPQYSFAYDVHDSLTGDSKSQAESRNGGLVQGRYTVADPDGTRRIVDYTADPINGFNAIVSKVPQAVAAPLVAKAAPIVAAAPALSYRCEKMKMIVGRGEVVIFAAFVAFVNAGLPISLNYDYNPQYSYSYGVNDAFTGDSKSQFESRSGDFVKGQYSLLESDGTKRVVDYASDPVNGFNAVVSKHPVAVVPAPVVPAPVVSAPIVSAPVVPAPVVPAYPYALPYSGYHGYSGYPYGYATY